MTTALLVCSTPYQLMVGILLSHQLFKNGEKVDLVLTDTFLGADRIADKAKKTGEFRNVYLFEVERLIKPCSLCDKKNKILFLMRFSKKIDELFNGKFEAYDTILFNCEEFVLYNLITYNRMLKPDSQVIRYEEGYSSYTENQSASEKSRKLINFRNVLSGIKGALTINAFAVFEPRLLIYQYPYPIIQIERSYIQSNEYKKTIANIFETNVVISKYQNKYVIFEESFSRDGFDIDDIQLYSKLFDIIGDENVSVKLHPRSIQNRFSDFKCDVHLPEGVPWEAILLSGSFQGLQLIALASGSIINSRLLLGDKTSAYLLYKCLEKKPPALNKEFEIFIRKLNDVYKGGIIIPENYNEMKTIFESQMS